MERVSMPRREKVRFINATVLPKRWREVTMFFPCSTNTSKAFVMAAMPEQKANTFVAPVRAFTLSSRYITVGFITLE